MAEDFTPTVQGGGDWNRYTTASVSVDQPDAERIVCRTTESRLLAALCLTTPPDDDDYRFLLANLIALTLTVIQQGWRTVQSKAVRNFSVRYTGDRAAMRDFYHDYADLLSRFSKCGSRVEMQSNWNQIIYAPDALQLSGLLPDNPPMLGGAE